MSYILLTKKKMSATKERFVMIIYTPCYGECTGRCHRENCDTYLFRASSILPETLKLLEQHARDNSKSNELHDLIDMYDDSKTPGMLTRADVAWDLNIDELQQSVDEKDKWAMDYCPINSWHIPGDSVLLTVLLD